MRITPDIISEKQFVSLGDNLFFPMYLVGCNNLTEITDSGRERFVRGLDIASPFTKDSNCILSRQQMIDRAYAVQSEIVERCNNRP